LNLKKRAVGLAALIGLAGGLVTVAAPAAHAGNTGSCSGIEFFGKIDPPLPTGGATISTVTKTKSAKDGLHVWDAGGGTITGPNDTGGTVADFGHPMVTDGTANCTFGSHPAETDVAVSAKLSGLASCDPAAPPTNLPLNGKIGFKGAAGTMAQAYVRVAGFDPSFQDVISLTGIVVKTIDGLEPIGSTVSGETYFDPIVKLAADTPVDYDGPGPAPTITLPKNDYSFDLSQIAASCGTTGNPIGLILGGDGVSLIGSAGFPGISFDN
jgi:hypothetical protein